MRPKGFYLPHSLIPVILREHGYEEKASRVEKILEAGDYSHPFLLSMHAWCIDWQDFAVRPR